MSDDLEAQESERAAEIKKRLHAKQDFAIRTRKNRHYLKHPGETSERPDSLCNGCGGSYVARGYCTNCGAPA